MIHLLSEPIRRFIRDKRWDQLRPIQAAAIDKVINGSEHLILASRTASGKTEAAFLPILSKVDFRSPGVKVLYISPLIALINDQFVRIEDLCRYLDVKITKWHGEASRSLKQQLVKDPNGILLITPESLEAMLANAPFNAKILFSSLEYVVIDEIHSFMGSDRGQQLKSILSRIQELNTGRFRIVGLSATIGDYQQAKKMTGDEQGTKVLLDRGTREMEAEFRYYGIKGNELPLELMKDLYLSTKDNKVLIFPNSRGRAEEIAVKLKKISARVSGHNNYFSHHSSVDRELREYIEQFAKSNVRYPFAIACTSTLELGIDIGSVDKVVQVDAAHSISSLVQRIGRSGRREGELSRLLFYATDEWSLLQSLACYDLYKEGYVEPLSMSDRPYDILLHQILAYVKQLGGCTFAQLKDRIGGNFALRTMSGPDLEMIVSRLVEHNILELIGGELIIGTDGEWLVNGKDFYSVFKTEVNYKVSNYDKPVGEIPFSFQLSEGENILLAARIWKILEVDHKSKKIIVAPANDGRKPVFSGSAGDVHYKVRERMLQLLVEERTFEELDETAVEALRQIRAEFRGYAIAQLDEDRPVALKEGSIHWFSFQSTNINRTLAFLFDLIGLENSYIESNSSFVFSAELDVIRSMFQRALTQFADLDFHLENLLVSKPEVMAFSKWGEHLPVLHKRQLLEERYFDFVGTQSFLENANLVERRSHLQEN